MSRRIDWKAKIVEYKQSGMSQQAWCKEQCIPLGTFCYQLKKDRCSTGFVELKQPRSGLTLLIGSLHLELDPDFDPITLKRFLQSVGALC